MAPPQDPEDLLRAAADAQQALIGGRRPIWEMERAAKRPNGDIGFRTATVRPSTNRLVAFRVPSCVIVLGILQLLFAVVVSNGRRLIGPS